MISKINVLMILKGETEDMNLNRIAKEAHQTAVEHGFWEPEPTFGELVALMHSELSEALEEYRAGRPMAYKPCGIDRVVCQKEACGFISEDGTCEYMKDKPEGIAVELADCVIRILDFLGSASVDIDGIIERKKNASLEVPDNFGDLIARLHLDLSLAYETEYRKTVSVMKLIFCIMRIQKWEEKNRVDLLPIIREKMDYNKTRPYRHGGKRL